MPSESSIYNDQQFEAVELDTLLLNPCSPVEPGPEFIGILINAPKWVRLQQPSSPKMPQADFMVPVCGFYMLKKSFQNLFPDVKKAMRLIVTNQQTREQFSGKAVRLTQASPDPIRPKVDPERTKNKVTGGYFNSDLVRMVSLPRYPAVYEVHVALGDPDTENFFQSNTLEIEILEVSR